MNNAPQPLGSEQHRAWLASLSPDESLVVHTPAGYLFDFLAVAMGKRALMTKGIKPAEQLAVLERMHALVDEYFTPEMLAAVQPMCDTGCAIFEEATSLDPPTSNGSDGAWRESARILTCPRVFWHFVTLNPSILIAIKIADTNRRRRTAMPPDPKDPLTETEKKVFGEDARRHPVTGFPIERGSGALPERMQAQNHIRHVAETEGPEAADAMRKRLEAFHSGSSDRRFAPVLVTEKNNGN